MRYATGRRAALVRSLLMTAAALTLVSTAAPPWPITGAGAAGVVWW
jgi:hypothetical protein